LILAKRPGGGMNNVELMSSLDRFQDGVRIQIIFVFRKAFLEFGDLTFIDLSHDIDVIRQPGLSIGNTGDSAGNEIGNIQFFKTSNEISEEFRLFHERFSWRPRVEGVFHPIRDVRSGED
jgi:hypothetical protein